MSKPTSASEHREVVVTVARDERADEFFDDTGARFSVADMEPASVEELQAEGFPFSSPSEESVEARASLERIVARKRGR